jgi:hypothetical protein
MMVTLAHAEGVLYGMELGSVTLKINTQHTHIKELRPFLGYFHAMHSTASNKRYCDHRGHTHHVKGTKGDRQEMTR